MAGRLTTEAQRSRNGTAAKATRTKKKFIGIVFDRLAAHALRLADAAADGDVDAIEIRRLMAVIREARRRTTHVRQKGATDTEIDDFTVSTDAADVPPDPQPVVSLDPKPPLPPATRARRAPQPSRTTKSARAGRAGVPPPPRNNVGESPERQIAHYFPL